MHTQEHYKRVRCEGADPSNSLRCPAAESGAPVWCCAFYHDDADRAATVAAAKRLAPKADVGALPIAAPAADGASTSGGGTGEDAAAAAGGGVAARELKGHLKQAKREGAGAAVIREKAAAAGPVATPPAVDSQKEFPGGRGGYVTPPAVDYQEEFPSLAAAGAGGGRDGYATPPAEAGLGEQTAARLAEAAAAVAGVAAAEVEVAQEEVLRFLYFGPEDGSVGVLDWYYQDPDGNVHVSEVAFLGMSYVRMRRVRRLFGCCLS